ncbi:MAG TPA: zf-HC2 domain-containing protein [Blastocatellia bacterium]|nr:zf-HC2 domain-containing protein [Blastocatellia bacterium]
MARTPAHPDKQLFDYLNDALEPSSARRLKQHLDGCPQCARAAAVFRALKSTRLVSTGGDSAHPDASEIAALFYGRASIARPQTAAHVATCPNCAEELSEYARAETAASLYHPAEHASGEVPAASWEMIREWEESSFAMPRPATEVIGQELLAKLFNLAGERRDWIRDARRTTTIPAAGTAHTDAVTVIVVDRSGEVRSVEIFLKETDASGADVLRHAEKSERFDNKAVHVLRDAEGRQRVASYRVQCDTIRFEEASSEERTDYFIIEE